MKIKIDANSHQTITQVGSFLRILDSGAKVKIKLYFADGSSRENWLNSGMAWKTEQEFLSLEIYSENSQTIEYLTASGEILDSRIFGQIKTTEQGGNLSGLPALVFDVNAKTIAENLNRRELHIKAAESNSAYIWIGSGAVGQGIPIKAGEIAVLRASAALSLYAENLTDSVFLVELF